MFKLGYNTNGFAFHRLEDAIDIIADIGYSCVGITLDTHHLNPFEASASEVNAIAQQLHKRGLSCVIETGSRYLLDPRRKHRPTLIDDDPESRIHFLYRAAEIASDLGAPALSYWAGARPKNPPVDDVLFGRLALHIEKLEEVCQRYQLKAALEPEPGMLVESMNDVETLAKILGFMPGLTIDVGHLECIEEEPEDVYIRRYAANLHNVHLDDMLHGKHRHLNFGAGTVDMQAVFKALSDTGFEGPACVELSEASRVAVTTAQESYDFLTQLMN
ncbi:sugar phosphate isomerase/epimerase [Planctomycetota bacterium]|nr:sugar phosphate isomerase/epimerase [Planctomycetota bacterium]